VGALAAVGGGTEQKGKAVLEPEEEEDSAKEREVGPAPMQGLSPRGAGVVQRASKEAGAAGAGGGLGKTSGARHATADVGVRRADADAVE
jgi:hypothetical protein